MTCPLYEQHGPVTFRVSEPPWSLNLESTVETGASTRSSSKKLTFARKKVQSSKLVKCMKFHIDVPAGNLLVLHARGSFRFRSGP
jgi:hypothetical protein